MSTERADQPLQDPLAQLERSVIEEFLRSRGHDFTTLSQLPEEQANALLKEASLYASGKLTEVESRAHYIGELHSGAPPMPSRRFGTRGV